MSSTSFKTFLKFSDTTSYFYCILDFIVFLVGTLYNEATYFISFTNPMSSTTDSG